MNFKNIVFVMCIGMVWAQTEPSLSNVLDNLPPELQGKVDEKQITDLKNKSIVAFKKKCEENAGPDAFLKAEQASIGFADCVKSLVNVESLQDEIEKAKPNGEVDEVFKKYCQKTPLFKSCFRNVTESIKPCFSVEEQKNIKSVYNVSEQLVEFVCFKEGDRIALFIAENGPECIQEKQAEIETCLNNTLGAEMHFNDNEISLDSIPKIKFGEKECNQLSDLQQCVVSALETCSAPTSANIVESLFKFARKATPCKDVPEKPKANAEIQESDVVAKTNKPNSADRLFAKSLAMGAIALTLFV